MIPLPGHSREESIQLLLDALRDPNNRGIFSNIRTALRKGGVSSQIINYYETFGEMPESDDADDAYDRLMGDSRKINTSNSKLLGFLLISILIVVAVMIGIFKVVIDNGNDSTIEPPSITEMAPMQDGDKL